MNNINTNNMLSPVQANRAEMDIILKGDTAQYASPDAFGYDWFVLPDGDTSNSPLIKTPLSAIGSISLVDTTTSSGNSIEARIERIIQHILPRA